MPDTLIDAILERGIERPNDLVLTVDDRSITWGELSQMCQSFAAATQARGIAKGERVGILSYNSIEAVVTYFGSVMAGLVAVPLPMSVRPQDLTILIDDCAPKLVVADPSGLKLLADTKTDAEVIVLNSDTGGTPWAKALGKPENYVRPEIDQDTLPFNIIYSSGTTGRPKGIVHSHTMRNGQASRAIFGFDPSSVTLLSTPLYSNTTLIPMIGTVFHGGQVVMMSKFDTLGYLTLAEKVHATHTMLVPVQYQRLMAHEEFDKFDLSSFKVKQSTSAPMNHELKRDIIKRWPGQFKEAYGLTEGGVSCSLDASANPDKLHSVGKPYPGSEIIIVSEDGKILPQGETGEVVGWAPMFMMGYWNLPETTAAMKWKAPNGKTYYKSGDLGMIDEDGFVVLQGRIKDVIISGGFNIYPVDLEAELQQHPDVLEVAVAGIPSKDWGESPQAFVVPKKGVTTDPEAIMAWANERLGRMQRVKGVSLLDTLPRSSIGKVLKKDLVSAFLADQA